MKKIWIIGQAYCGIVEEPEIFYSESSALKRYEELMEEFNPEKQDIQIFEKEIQFEKEVYF